MMRRLLCLAALLAATHLVSLPAYADDDEGPANARLLGYEKEIAPPQSNVMIVFLIWTGIAAAGIGVMFMNAKRSHLD